ncbi:MAG: preprotein translocase subunit SecE [Candidatus Curtissbacteria bacterium]|nr:preprotein translocase subunit SecE [Candidatus Curtissbacteria bacterium]
MAFNPLTYVKESKQELEKVIWPNRDQTIRFTLVVIFTSLVVGAYVAGLDAMFTKIAERFLYK